MKSELRMRFETVFYTEQERECLRQERIREAMAWIPPMTYSKEVILSPGDAGYDNAPYVMECESGGMSYPITLECVTC